MGNEKAPVRIFFSIVYLRKCNNVTQAQLAEKLEITQSQLALIESGRRKPNPKLLHKIADGKTEKTRTHILFACLLTKV